MARLLESDFLTVDLSRITKGGHAEPASTTDSTSTDPDKGVTDKAGEDQKQETAKIADWGEELKKRLETNKKMSRESQQSEYEIETKFFNDFFKSRWDADLAKQLNSLGEPLKKALKTLGFNDRVNPILAFLTNKYVQENLLRTKLLNTNTFKAIYNAVAKKLVADSEFFSARDYNIIYCKDLYTKSLNDIMAYLNIQKEILKVSASAYTVENQIKNKKVFFFLQSVKELEPVKRAAEIATLDKTKGLPSAKNDKTKLNSVALAKKLAETLTGIKIKDNNNKNKSSNTPQKIASMFKSDAQKLAAIQFLCTTTDSAEAKKALSYDKFKSIKTGDLLAATSWLAEQGFMQDIKANTAAADALVAAILNSIQ